MKKDVKGEKKAKVTENGYYTVGQISRMLNGQVSPSTVKRMFNKGEFAGRVNMVSGKRLIQWQSVLDWFKDHNLSLDNIVVEKKRGEKWKDLKRKY